MKLFSWTDTYFNLFHIWSNGSSNIADLIRRNLRYEDFTSKVVFKSKHNKSYTIFKGNIETSHAHIGDRQELSTLITLLDEEWNNRATRTHYVSITNYRETNILAAFNVIGCCEELIRSEFGCAIKVDRSTSLVSRKCHNILYSLNHSRINHVHCTMNVGLDALLWVVLCGIYLLNSSRMDDNVNTLAGTNKTILITYITYKITKLREILLWPNLLHVELLQFATRVYNNLLHIRIITKDNLYKLLTE